MTGWRPWMTSEAKLAKRLRDEGVSYWAIATQLPGRTDHAVAAFLRAQRFAEERQG